MSRPNETREDAANNQTTYVAHHGSEPLDLLDAHSAASAVTLSSNAEAEKQPCAAFNICDNDEPTELAPVYDNMDKAATLLARKEVLLDTILDLEDANDPALAPVFEEAHKRLLDISIELSDLADEDSPPLDDG